MASGRGIAANPTRRGQVALVLDVLEAVYGPDHPEVAVSLTNLAIVGQQLGTLPARRSQTAGVEGRRVVRAGSGPAVRGSY